MFLQILAVVGATLAAYGGGLRADNAVFVSGTFGYHTFRIPGVLRTKTPNVVLAFAEGRKLSSADHGARHSAGEVPPSSSTCASRSR